MKNIHIIPTDKPSRLFIDIDNDKLTITNNPIGGEHFMNQNIYITSDEEIKEGFVLLPNNKIVKLPKVSIAPLNNFLRCYSLSDCKKIILTTDIDLIVDGVQAIDDDCLEWFVKNPSCENIEVIKTFEDYTIVGGKSDEIYYKIIIPKEEPKKETLQEAISKFFDNKKHPTSLDIAEFGAKWQQERSYSEEDIENIWNEFVKELPPINNGASSDFLVYLKQFKNK